MLGAGVGAPGKQHADGDDRRHINDHSQQDLHRVTHRIHTLLERWVQYTRKETRTQHRTKCVPNSALVCTAIKKVAENKRVLV